MTNISVFEVEINRHGTDQLVKRMHLLGYSIFQVSHIVTELMFGENGEFTNDAVEIGSIKKVPGIVRIENPEFIMDMLIEERNEYDGSEPLEDAKQLPNDQTMTFQCECHEKLTVPQTGWSFIVCPNCETKIMRNEIKEAGGLYYLDKTSKK